MANNTNRTKKVVPEAQDSLDKFKYEVAQDMAVKKIFKNFLFFISCYFIFKIFKAE